LSHLEDESHEEREEAFLRTLEDELDRGAQAVQKVSEDFTLFQAHLRKLRELVIEIQGAQCSILAELGGRHAYTPQDVEWNRSNLLFVSFLIGNFLRSVELPDPISR